MKYNAKYPQVTKEDVKKKINALRTNWRKEFKKVSTHIYSNCSLATKRFLKLFLLKHMYLNELRTIVLKQICANHYFGSCILPKFAILRFYVCAHYCFFLPRAASIMKLYFQNAL